VRLDSGSVKKRVNVSNCDTHLNVDKPHFPRPSLIKSFTSIRQMSAETASCGDPGTMARNMLQTAPDLGSRAHQGRLVMCSGREREKRFTWRERERLQCFSQPASLITYRRRQRSNVESIKTVQNELENLHMILLCKKGSHGVCVRGNGNSPRRKANGRKTKGESLAKGSDLHHFHREWWRLQSNAAITPIVQSRHYQTDKYQHVITVAVS